MKKASQKKGEARELVTCVYSGQPHYQNVECLHPVAFDKPIKPKRHARGDSQ